MRDKILSIINHYTDINSGDPWHGSSLQSIINKINEETVNIKSSNTNKTVNELLMHILAWRAFVLHKVKEENIDIVLNSEGDWPRPNKTFELIVKDLDVVFENLQRVLESKDDSWLSQSVKGKAYTYEKMLYGLISHDLHHFSQITLLNKELNQ